MVDTLLLNEEDGNVLGLAGGIVKAIVGGPEQSRFLPVLYGEMLGRKWVLGRTEEGKWERYKIIIFCAGNAYPRSTGTRAQTSHAQF